MKFSKRDISDIKFYYEKLKRRIEISEIYENNNKKPIPEFIKVNLIKYGIYVGRIYEIIRKRISLKDDEKNLNADELIKSEIGEEFFKWICFENKKYIYGRDNNNRFNLDINDDIINKCCP